jgi:hypothetical protein
MQGGNDKYGEHETIEQREAALKRMLSTPHKPQKRRALLSVRCFTTLTVRETLTFRALERVRRTFPVFHLRVFHLKSYSAR